MVTSFLSHRTWALCDKHTIRRCVTVPASLCQFVPKTNTCNFAFVVWGCHSYIKSRHTERGGSHAAVINASSVISPISCAAWSALCFPLRSPEDLAAAGKKNLKNDFFLCDTGSSLALLSVVLQYVNNYLSLQLLQLCLWHGNVDYKEEGGRKKHKGRVNGGLGIAEYTSQSSMGLNN